MKWLFVAMLALLSASAHADPVTALTAIATFFVSNVYVKLAIVAFAYVYGSAKARSQRRKAEAQAKAAYNSSLTDRNVTALRAAPPRRYVYGRCWTGGDIVGIFTTDKQGTDDNGNAYTKPDAYKHLVVVFAGHQSQAMHDITLDGKSISMSTLDVNGWSTASEFSKVRKAYREFTLNAGASKTLPFPMTVENAFKTTNLGDFGLPNSSGLYTLTDGNRTITNTDSEQVQYGVFMDEVLSSVRVAYKLGSDTQLADTYLTTLLPSKWTANHRLRGLTYAIITLDLEDRRFQSTPPQILAEISGRLCYDPRTTTTIWSENVAVCLRDYIKNIIGVPDTMIDDAAFIAAANACDVGVQNKKYINGVLNETTKSKFTFNGVVTTDDSREAMLDEFADAMAGFVTQSAKWTCGAGVWTSPVMTLNDDDLDGQIEVVQGDTPMSDLFNGVRGQYIPNNTATPIDYQPYKNATLVTADGKNLWRDKTLPFTNDAFIAMAIARIMTEVSRNGQVIRYPAKLKAIGLQIGDRVTVNNTEYGLVAKTYRVTDKQFAVDAPVVLTLQEDAAAAYDLIDSTVADPTPNTGLPNPFDIASLPSISGLALLSNASTLRRQTDGAVSPRVKVTWNKYTGPYVADGSGYIWVKWRRVVRDAIGSWESQRLPGDSVSTFIEGVTDGDSVMVGVWAENSFGGTSSTVFDSVTAVGKTALPTNVGSFTAVSVPGAINYSWTDASDVDYEDTELRVGSTWASATRVFKGKANTYTYPQSIPSSITMLAKHFDRWGNESSSAASATASSLSLNDTRNYDFTNGMAGWTGISSVATGDSGASGGTYGVHGAGIGALAYPQKVPVDPSRRYRVTVRVWADAGGGGQIYAGVVPFDASGNVISNSGGATYPYCASLGLSHAGPGWRVFSGVIQGTQPVPLTSYDAYKFPVGTVYAAPMVFPYTGFTGPLLIDYCTLEDITDAAAVAESGFSVHRMWDFNSATLEGWQLTNLTAAYPSYTQLQITSTAADATLYISGLSFHGSAFYKVRMRVRREAGNSWQGDMYYTTVNHGESDTYKLTIPANEQPGSDWTILEWDIGKHGNSGAKSDWPASEIRGIRFDLSQGGVGDAFVIDWIAIGKSAAASDLSSVTNSQWVGRGVMVSGDTAIKVYPSTAWNADVYSREQYYGGCAASASFDMSAGRSCMFGLNSDPLTDSDYASLDFAFYYTGTTIEIYESGAARGVYVASPAAGDVYTVAYDGSSVYYLRNGTVLRSIPANPGQSFFFDSSFVNEGAMLTGMRFGPLTSNNWTAIGGGAKPSDYATADLTLVNSGNCTQTGNRATKTGGTAAWDGGMHSRDGFLGGAAASIYVHNSQTDASKEMMFGLNNSPTTANYADINFAFYLLGAGAGTGNLYVYLEGTIGNGGVSIGTFQDNDLLSVTYDGHKARWYKNGVVLYELVSVDTSSRWHFDCSIVPVGEYFDRISFRPMSMVSGIATQQVAANAITAFVKTDYDPAEAAISAGSSFALSNIATSSYATAGGGAVVTMFTGKLNVRLPAASTISQITAQITVKVEGATEAFFPVTLAKADGGSGDTYACNWAWNVYHAPANSTWDYAIDVNLIPNVSFSGTGETVYSGVRTITMEFKR